MTTLAATTTPDWIKRRESLAHSLRSFLPADAVLTDAEDRTKYRQAMNEAVSANGHVIIATFAPDAPPKCSGLEVVRYSPTSLSAAVGQGFELVETLDEVHVTPTGKAQRFIYCHFVRRIPCSPHT